MTLTKIRIKSLLPLLVIGLLGVLIGAYFFSNTQPRSLLRAGECGSTCYQIKDIEGLIASVGIHKLPGATPFLVRESDKCLAIKYPYSPHRFHFVLFPKRDIRDIGDFAEGDQPYMIDCLAMARELVSQNKLTSYRFYSNGPMEQTITYLHFHLISDQ